MSKQVSNIKITDNSKEILAMMASRTDKILEAIGQQAAKNCRENMRATDAIDTGLARNSVTYAVSGKSAAIETYKADKPRKGKTNIETGSYSGTAPNDLLGKKAVYVGSNVEYFKWIENGTKRMKPRPNLKRAVEEHKDQYKNIALKNMKQG